MFCNLKTLTITYITITAIFFLAACHNNVRSVKKNDTSAVIQILLDSAHKEQLLTATELPSLKDTLIFKRNDILIRHLPTNLPYKLLSEDEMCKLMATYHLAGLQFVALDKFEKTSNGYHTALGAHCMSGGTEQTDSDETFHSVCEPEKYCNTVLYIDVTKEGNNFAAHKFGLMTY
jgi:hypothetical protein